VIPLTAGMIEMLDRLMEGPVAYPDLSNVQNNWMHALRRRGLATMVREADCAWVITEDGRRECARKRVAVTRRKGEG
jgi:hypothetical protein